MAEDDWQLHLAQILNTGAAIQTMSVIASADGPLRTKMIADRSDYSRGSVLKHIDDLVTAGFVRRVGSGHPEYELADRTHANALTRTLEALPGPFEEALTGMPAVAAFCVLADAGTFLRASEIAANCDPTKASILNHIDGLLEADLVTVRENSWPEYKVSDTPQAEYLQEANDALGKSISEEIAVDSFVE